MAKKNQEAAGEAGTDGGTVTAQTTTNFTLTYRRDHPQNRSSYGIAGQSGIVVFDRNLFADPGAPPATITVDVPLALPKADAKSSRAAEAAARAEEKARKAQERIAAQEEKAKERARKAEEALAKARARVDAAAGKQNTESGAAAE